jgi:hypothetical protein
MKANDILDLLTKTLSLASRLADAAKAIAAGKKIDEVLPAEQRSAVARAIADAEAAVKFGTRP